MKRANCGRPGASNRAGDPPTRISGFEVRLARCPAGSTPAQAAIMALEARRLARAPMPRTPLRPKHDTQSIPRSRSRSGSTTFRADCGDVASLEVGDGRREAAAPTEALMSLPCDRNPPGSREKFRIREAKGRRGGVCDFLRERDARLQGARPCSRV